MTPIAKMVREMIERGVDIEVISLAVTTAEQMLIPRNSTETAEEKRKRKDRDRKRNSTEFHGNSTEIPRNEENASISKDLKKDSKRQNRGTRIATDWTPSDAERSFAKAEGFSDWEIQREVQKFRDYWTACAGAKGVKLDWIATWRQWIRNGADRAGKTPAPTGVAAVSVGGYYAKVDSEQLAAWDAYSLRTTGKTMPRDRKFGWYVKSEWPPEVDQDLPFDAASPAKEAAE
jgi:hypothetical protein